MCVGVRHLHSACRHRRQFEPIEACADYSASEKRCTTQERVVHTIYIEAPRLCVSCFRRVEDDIFNRVDSTINAVMREINEVNNSLQGQLLPLSRKKLEKRREDLEEEIRTFKELRKEEIDEFRAKQGVFADG